MRIVTEYDPKPIPDRNCDWSAVDDATYDGPGCPIGFGPTKQAAIEDLMEQISEREVDCAAKQAKVWDSVFATLIGGRK